MRVLVFLTCILFEDLAKDIQHHSDLVFCIVDALSIAAKTKTSFISLLLS